MMMNKAETLRVCKLARCLLNDKHGISKEAYEALATLIDPHGDTLKNVRATEERFYLPSIIDN